MATPKKVTITDRVAQARATIQWPTVQTGHEDEAALDVLGTVLGGLSGESRLYKKLMYEKPLAANASAFHNSEMLAGTFGLTITAQRGQPLDALVTMADAEVERLKAEGPTEAEVKKAQIAQGRGLNFGLQTMGRKADFLNQNNVVYGDPLAYKAELMKIDAVTPADVKRVAAKYLTANRVRLDVNPGAPTPRPAEPPRRIGQVAQAFDGDVRRPSPWSYRLRPQRRAEAGADARLHPAEGRPPQALQRP